MFDAIDIVQTLLQRLRPAKNLEQALKQLLAPSMIRDSLRLCASPSELISVLAERYDLNHQALVCESAERLGMRAVSTLHIPSKELIRQSGYEAERLRSIPAIPQRGTSGLGWNLVVADPGVIAVDEFLARGIEITLALKEDIDTAWDEFCLLLKKRGQSELSEAQLFTVLERLVKDAIECSASEVFIGHPEPSSYEFVANERRYTGKVHGSVFRALLLRFEGVSEGSFSYLTEDGLNLEFALTKNFSNSVIYLNWKSKNISSTQTEVLQSSTELDFDLTVERAPKNSPSEVKITSNLSDSEEAGSKKILVLEDDFHFADILSRVLERRGYEVSHFANGEEALRYLKESEVLPALIISDVHMPTMDGCEFLTLVRRTEHDVPVVMLTSDDDVLLEAELVEKGANAFVRKQDDVRVLLAWCGNLTLRSSKEVEEQLINAA